MRRAITAVVVVGVLVSAPAAHGFTIASGFTEACHESITMDGFDDFLLEVPTGGIVVPEGSTWREVALFLEDLPLIGTAIDVDQLSDAQRFMFISLIVGVRSPDTEGHSILNFAALRQLHSDPDAKGQYLHALRAPADDLQEGDEYAVQGTRVSIRESVAIAREYYERTAHEQVIVGQFYLDFYGRIDVEVWAPMYYLGRAAHALQDSFSHTIRSEEDALQKIVHVLNYVDAIGTDFDEDRDGLAHSDSMDDCVLNADGTSAAARVATLDLFYASRAVFSGLDEQAVETVLDKWVTLKGGCNKANTFCGNDHWLSIVREKQTKPYLEAIFGCSASDRPGRGLGELFVVFGLLVLVGRLARRLSRTPTR